MSKKVKIILVVAAVAVIAGLSVYYFYWKPKKEAEKKESEKKAADAAKTEIKSPASTTSVTGVAGSGSVKMDLTKREVSTAPAQEVTIIS
jgi:flagellar basal body-associated protein FliL